MRSLTSTLLAAVTARVRRPVATMQVDWAGPKTSTSFGSTYDDVSGVLQSVTLDRTITSDLPDEAQLVSGGAAAQVTAVLGGNMPDGTPVAKALSAYAGLVTRRLASALQLKMGMIGTAGTELVSEVVGNVTQVDVDAATRQVTLTGLDARERLDTRISLPAVVAVDAGNPYFAPGLDAGWVMDYVLRRNGLYRQMPPRTGPQLVATMFGSAFPETGGAGASSTGLGAPFYSMCKYNSSANAGRGVLTFTNTARGKAVDITGDVHVEYTFVSTFNLDPGLNLFLEWETLKLVRPASLPFQWCQVGDSNNSVLLEFGTTGQVKIYVFQGGTLRATLTPASAIMPNATETYFAVHLAFAVGGGITANVRIGGTTYTASGTVLATGGNGPIRGLWIDPTRFTVSGATLQVGQMQVTGEAFSTGMWRDTWVPDPTAPVLEPTLNPLLGMPSVDDEDAWTLLQEIAAAETGVAWFDEDGIFRFWNRNHMSGGASVLTLTPVTHLKALSSSEVVGTVRNVVNVPATQYAAMDAAAVLWSLSEVTPVAPGATVVLPVQLPGPLIGATVGVTMNIAAAIAYPNSDGTGALQPLNYGYLPISPTRGQVAVQNPNASTVWLVDSSGSPSVTVTGRCVVPSDSPYSATASDSTSITAYGQQPIDVGDNRWRQAAAVAQALATALLARMKDPHPVLADVPIIGDLRLQIGDRITITEAATLGLNTDFWVVHEAKTLDTSGLTQTITVRQV